MFKIPKPAPRQSPETMVKKSRARKLGGQVGTQSMVPASPFRYIFKIVIFIVALILLTHFIQNADHNSAVKGAKRWLSKNGYHVFGVTSSLELVLDLTSLSHWEG